MRVRNLLSGVITTAVLAGCMNSKVDDSNDLEHQCSSGFLKDMSDLKLAASELKQAPALTPNEREVQTLKLQLRCEKFFAINKETVCAAEVKNSQGLKEDQIIDTEELKSICESLSNEQALADDQVSVPPASDAALPPTTKAPQPEASAQLPAPSASTPPASVPVTTTPPSSTVQKIGSDTFVSDLKEEQIQFQVISEERVKQSSVKPPLVWVEGKLGPVTDFRKEIAQGKTYCVIDAETGASFKNGLKIPVLAVAQVSDEKDRRPLRKITFSLKDYRTMIGCGKLSMEPFQIKDIQNSLVQVLEVHVSGK